MLSFEIHALNDVTDRAKATEAQDKAVIRDILDKNLCADIDIGVLVKQLLFACDVTLNFHPDRVSNNGKIIIHSMIENGQYHSQFATGTTNGGRTAYPNGDRDIWEKNMFRNAYHSGETTINNRPKYGALNIHNYKDGASVRFGSCFFTLSPHVVERCTFAFGDSSTNPEALGTRNAFYAILRAILNDIEKTGNLLNKGGYTIRKAVDHILSMKKSIITEMGKNLDYCIETHIHGDIDLRGDIDCLYLDESFRDSVIHEQAVALSGQYGIHLLWIPERKIHVDSISDEFRGPAIPILAKRIISHFNIECGFINAELIGRASRFATLYPEKWSDIGNEYELFQYIKQLWHTVAFFG